MWTKCPRVCIFNVENNNKYVYFENMPEHRSSIVYVYYLLWSGSLQKLMCYRALFFISLTLKTVHPFIMWLCRILLENKHSVLNEKYILKGFKMLLFYYIFHKRYGKRYRKC